MSGGLIDVAIPVVTFCVMVIVGLDLSAGEFRRVTGRPLVLLTGLLAPVIVLPPLAWGLVTLSSPSRAVATGLLIMAACPIGGISNVYSLLARGDTALSVTLTAASCLFGIVTIPLVSGGLTLALGHEFALWAPGRLLIGQFALISLVPVTLGMVLRARWPDVIARYRPALQQAAFVLVGLVIALIVWSEFDLFLRELTGTVPRALVFMLVSLAAGAFSGALIRADRRERTTLALEFGTRNVAVATAIAFAMLGRADLAVFSATYFLVEVPLMLLMAIAFRRRAYSPPSLGRR